MCFCRTHVHLLVCTCSTCSAHVRSKTGRNVTKGVCVCVRPQALSLHLLEGCIDQVASSVSINWVQPRVLTKPQLVGLQQRLDTWVSKVTSLAHSLEDHSLGVSA